MTGSVDGQKKPGVLIASQTILLGVAKMILNHISNAMNAKAASSGLMIYEHCIFRTPPPIKNMDPVFIFFRIEFIH